MISSEKATGLAIRGHCRASAALLIALSVGAGDVVGQREFTYEFGAIVRGDTTRPRLSLVFTGDEYSDGTHHITSVLDSLHIKASFFFTGRFYRNPAFEQDIRNLRENGHYLGAHSDGHLLYCSWDVRDSLLVTREEFEDDLAANYLEMKRFSVLKEEASFFLPPYEWYNARIAQWTDELGLQLINYSPGTRSHADYTTPDMGSRYVSSETIVSTILSYENAHSNGLNGFILLSHVGVSPSRSDKFYYLLGPLIAELSARGYKFVRIDELLSN